MKIFITLILAGIFFACNKEDGITSEKNQNPFFAKAALDSGWQLSWSEEFNYSGLPDASVWNYETGFVRNNEPQYYVAGKKANSKVAGGYLKITALYDSTKPHSITSASIITKNKMSFLYGRIEVRAKMPKGSGAWPAIWLEGINRDTVFWPRCGELDMMEWLGQYAQYILGSIHTIATSGSDTAQITPYVPADYQTLSTKFHVYAIEWDSTSISYFYDDIKYAVYTKENLTPEEWAPFTKPMYLILNLAMGVSGGTIDYSKFPFIYQVDYVRYYQKR